MQVINVGTQIDSYYEIFSGNKREKHTKITPPIIYIINVIWKRVVVMNVKK